MSNRLRVKAKQRGDQIVVDVHYLGREAEIDYVLDVLRTAGLQCDVEKADQHVAELKIRDIVATSENLDGVRSALTADENLEVL